MTNCKNCGHPKLHHDATLSGEFCIGDEDDFDDCYCDGFEE